jgi:superfamily II DNA or RNA helicase
MIVLHAGLDRDGLLLWGEAPLETGDAVARPRRERRAGRARRTAPPPLPYDAGRERLAASLEAVGLSPEAEVESVVAWLPTAGGDAIASSGLVAPPPERGRPVLEPWTVTALRPSAADSVDLLSACLDKDTLGPGVVVGRDLAFAAAVLRFAGGLVAREAFVPGLAHAAQPSPRGRAVGRCDGAAPETRVSEDDGYEAVWTPVLAGRDAEHLARLARAMPPVSRALAGDALRPPRVAAQPLLAATAAWLLDRLVREAAREASTAGGPGAESVHERWLEALRSPGGTLHDGSREQAVLAAQVREWQRPLRVTTEAPFRLTFRLEEPGVEDPRAEPDGAPAANGRSWFVRYLMQSSHDPSLLVPAPQAWSARGALARVLRSEGFEPREHLLASLGQAAAIDPAVEESLGEPAPAGYATDARGAFEFLGSRATALEQAGFGVMLPAWWTGRGTRLRLTLRAAVLSPRLRAGAGLDLDRVVDVDWQVALGGDALSLAELQALAQLKAPLVRVRGRWVQVSAGEVEAALRLFSQRGRDGVRVRDLVALALGAPGAAAPPGLAFDGVVADGWIGELLERLEQRAALRELDAPAGFEGTLRPYQRRGFSWLAFLGELGLGACLADDMGLGKTVQALALVQRRWQQGAREPVLLVCPTSVVGNWEREAARFTPALPVLVHHGLGRARGGALAERAASHALVVSSYALLHRDLETLGGVAWAGVILDEAQNVKNAETRQARAARALRAGFRIALTGTPVENNVGDLWSLMEFLNPGLLGSRAEFKRSFFVPIQVVRDEAAAARLRRLTGPFVLRRLKTDSSIVADLPEKMEMKVFCSLTREQASLYAAVLADAMREIEGAEGIQRKGVVLATLSKLKQVCNHPAQLLKDRSRLAGRSGKLARLTEMLDEALQEGDRALVFTQFAEMGALLQRHLQESFGREALFLHGGTPKPLRDRMVERFQRHDGPAVFVLSLKAGGTGLNLTRANRVFHFDRWWNPAVENQATDRAFRIGQTRRVQVHKLVCAGTLEESIDALIEGKRELAEKVVGAGEGWLGELSTKELRQLLSLRPGAAAE